MKKWLWLGLWTLLINPVHWVHAQQKPVLLVLGDSLSAAYGLASSQQGWVALMQQQHPQLNVINASISGETTSGGLYRLPQLLQKLQPKTLIIELGANDALRGQNLTTTQHNLVKMIEMAQTQGCNILLLGIRLPTNYGALYDQRLQNMYQSLVQQYQLAFHPFFLEKVALEPILMQADGLHPNAQAQPLIWQTLSPLVDTVLQRTSKNL